MAVRDLGFGWDRAVGSLAAYRGPVTLAGLLIEDELIAVTIRGGEALPSVDLTYGGVRLFREVLGGEAVVPLLMGHRVGPLQLTFNVKESYERAYWVTQGAEYGAIARTTTPRLYCAYGWNSATGKTQQELLSPPLAARAKPYYPSTRDATLEILYGKTYAPSMSALVFRIELSLSFYEAYLGPVRYGPNHDLVISVLGSSKRAPGSEIHVVWRTNLSDAEFRRWDGHMQEGNSLRVAVGAAPQWYAIALLDESGDLMDELEGGFTVGEVDVPRLQALALPEAFSHLDTAWRLRFGRPVIQRPMLEGVADLTQPVASSDRDAFMARMTHLDDLLKAMRVDDSLLVTRRGLALPVDASISRIREAMRHAVHTEDMPNVEMALGWLSTANDIRVALQHKRAPGRRRPDLPTALSRLGLREYPPDWGYAWELVRVRVVEGLGDLRRAVLASAPDVVD